MTTFLTNLDYITMSKFSKSKTEILDNLVVDIPKTQDIAFLAKSPPTMNWRLTDFLDRVLTFF